ncbi:MAG: hypothetical protein ACR2KZ_04085, partial [Segetibacter sp.]
ITFLQIIAMTNKMKFIILLFSLTFFSSSCEKGIEMMTIEGFIKDRASLEPIAGIEIFVVAQEAPLRMGIFGGRNENVGQGTTDSKGYYKIMLTVFKEAANLELFINGANLKEGYVSIQPNISLSSLNRSGTNSLNYTLSPTAQFKIKYKNKNPIDDKDFFYFSYQPNGGTKGVLTDENCGTVIQSEAGIWTGKDVCGAKTFEAIAEKNIFINWTVKKNNVTRYYSDSIYVKRGVINEFHLNY